MRALIVSYVPLGYGSPQIISLAGSLTETFGLDVTLVHYQDMTMRATLKLDPRLTVRTFCSLHNAYHILGILEYLHYIAKCVEEEEPQVLVLTNPLHLMLARLLRRRPKIVIYYALELVHEYIVDLRTIAKPGFIDLMIQPEENRAYRDALALGLLRTPTVVMWNAVPNRPAGSAVSRQARFVYAGTLDPVTTYANDYFDPRMNRFPIDVFGRAWNTSGQAVIEQLSQPNRKGIRFRGFLPNDAGFENLLSTYAFSLVRWSDTQFDTYYCCPNKLFQAISLGVPVIATPNPICRKVVGRYGVGILAEDWSLDAYLKALTRARRLIGTSAHEAMIERALEAHAQELNWTVMFDKKVRGIVQSMIGQA